MGTNPCLICGSKLTLREGRAFCSNDSCASGGLFLRCGYCRSHSFSIHPDQMSCTNPKCRMHGTKRTFCQACNKTSQISYSERTICINRNCSSNEAVVSTCFFCGKRAFLKIPGIMICTKGDCPNILKRMEICFHCNEVALDVEESCCRNRDCAYHKVEVGSCSSCEGLSLIQQSGHEHLGNCLNPDCPLYDRPVPKIHPPSTVGLGADTPESDMESSFEKAAGPPRSRERVLATETELDVPAVGGDKVEGDKASARLEIVPPPPPPAAKPPPPPPEPSSFPERDPKDDFSIPLPEALRKPKEPPTRVTPSGRMVPVPPPEPKIGTPPDVPVGPVDTDDSLRSLFQFFRDRILADEKGVTHALFPVVGLSGSGKTTYLAMLGDILAHRGARYHFPWTGMDVKRVDVRTADMKGRVRDIAFDFAPEHVSGSLGKGLWTCPSGSPQCLVSRIARRGKLIAQVVSIEAPGEEYDATLKGLRREIQGESAGKPVREALADLLSRADGILFVLDPANEENAETYLDLFRLLGEAVAPRAIGRFRAEVKRKLGTRTRGGSKASQVDEVLSDLLREGEPGKDVSSGDETMVVAGGSPQLRFRLAEAIQTVREDLSLAADLPLGTDAPPEPTDGEEIPFQHLKHVAVVITKTDMYPVISPPDHYPDQRLPKCRPAISLLDNYLRLCGGGVRFYNASATGYSILRDTLFYPGKENTLTPINIAEPLFDMLG